MYNYKFEIELVGELGEFNYNLKSYFEGRIRIVQNEDKILMVRDSITYETLINDIFAYNLCGFGLYDVLDRDLIKKTKVIVCDKYGISREDLDLNENNKLIEKEFNLLILGMMHSDPKKRIKFTSSDDFFICMLEILHDDIGYERSKELVDEALDRMVF